MRRVIDEAAVVAQIARTLLPVVHFAKAQRRDGGAPAAPASSKISAPSSQLEAADAPHRAGTKRERLQDRAARRHAPATTMGDGP
jgi:hypothetical protein